MDDAQFAQGIFSHHLIPLSGMFLLKLDSAVCQICMCSIAMRASEPYRVSCAQVDQRVMRRSLNRQVLYNGRKVLFEGVTPGTCT